MSIEKKLSKMANSKTTNSLGFWEGFQRLMRSSYAVFPMVWWRVGVVNFLSFFTIFVGMCLSLVLFVILLGIVDIVVGFGGGTFVGASNHLLFGGAVAGAILLVLWLMVHRNARYRVFGVLALLAFFACGVIALVFLSDLSGAVRLLENFVVNLQSGFLSVGQVISFVLTIFFLINWIIVAGTMGKIANWLVVDSCLSPSSSPENPFFAYYVRSFDFFWKYLWLAACVVWYMCWPLAIFLGVTLLLTPSLISILGTTGKIVFVSSAVFIFFVLFGLTVFRGLKMIFSLAVLVHSDKTARESQQISRHLIQNNWFRVAGFLGVLFSIVLVVRFILVLPEELTTAGFLNFPSQALISFTLLDFVFNFFIFAPLVVTFIYLLMFQLAKEKQLTL